MFINRWVIVIAALVLGACAGSPDYRAADRPQDRGYYTQKITGDRYRVVYNGGRRSGLEETRDFALLRAAEVTVREGYDWFEIVDRDTHTRTNAAGPRAGVGYERAYFVARECGLLGCTSHVRPATYTRWEVASSHDVERHSHSIEVKLGKGALPADGRGYDAKSVIASVSAGR